MIYVVTIEDRHYNKLKFRFDLPGDAVAFMQTCINANAEIKATLEIESLFEEVSEDE